MLHQLKLANRYARIFVANQGGDDDACLGAREEELTQSCDKKTAKIWQGLVGGAIAMWKKKHPEARLSYTTIYNALERKLLKGYSGFTHLRRRNKRKYVRKDSATIKPDYTMHDVPSHLCAYAQR